MEDVAGEALGVNADERGGSGKVAHDEGEALFEAAVGKMAFKAVDAEMAEFAGEIRLSHSVEAKLWGTQTSSLTAL